jgi:hypothetical protein
MIAWIASYPRSGNHFFRTLLNRLYGIETLQPGLLTTELDRWLADTAASSQWHYYKTHDLPRGDGQPAFYLLRDGRDALVSYAWFVLQVQQKREAEEITPVEFRQTLKELIRGDHAQYGNWSSNVRAWGRQPNTVLVRYEDLVRSPREVVERAVAALGLSLRTRPDAVIPTFEQMRSQRPKMVRRGKVGSWEDEFPPELLPLFWERHAAVMHEFGYGETAQRRGA